MMLSKREPVKINKIIKLSKSFVDKIKLTILVDDSANTNKPQLESKHGLSILVKIWISGVESQILMDTGPPPDIALRNGTMMNIDLRKIDTIMLSHGHYDHTGALIEILKNINDIIPVVAHPKVFNQKFLYRPILRYVGPNFDIRLVKTVGGEPLLTPDSIIILNGVMSSGQISRKTNYEKTIGFWTVENERFIEDQIIDDQALIVNLREKGLVILTGCAHSGIVNTIEHAQKVTGVKDVHAIVGGLHLINSDEERMRKTLEIFEKIGVTEIYPCHCTGQNMINQMIDKFADRCRPIHTGDVIDF